MTKNIAVTAVLFSAEGLSVCLNGLLIFIFVSRKRLRAEPIKLLVIQLATIDIIASLLWTTSTAISAMVDKWPLPDVLCQLQVYVREFCKFVNVLTLMAFMFERIVRIFKPSKHQEVFSRPAIILLTAFVYIASAALASITAYNLASVEERYFEDEFQCALTLDAAPIFYYFSLAISLGLPFVFIPIGYMAILLRVSALKRQRGQGEYILLEQVSGINGNAFSQRLKDIYSTFRNSLNKTVESEDKTGKVFDNDGYIDDEIIESSDDEFEETQTQQSKDCYHLSKNDMRETHMYALISAIYFLMWVPYYVRLYLFAFNETSLGDGFIVITVCITHFGSAFKGPFYLMSDTVCGAARKTFCCRPKETLKNESANMK